MMAASLRVSVAVSGRLSSMGRLSCRILSFVNCELFNLLNKPRQIRVGETHLWRRHPIAFHIGRDMFVMREGGG